MDEPNSVRSAPVRHVIDILEAEFRAENVDLLDSSPIDPNLFADSLALLIARHRWDSIFPQVSPDSLPDTHGGNFPPDVGARAGGADIGYLDPAMVRLLVAHHAPVVGSAESLLRVCLSQLRMSMSLAAEMSKTSMFRIQWQDVLVLSMTSAELRGMIEVLTVNDEILTELIVAAFV